MTMAIARFLVSAKVPRRTKYRVQQIAFCADRLKPALNIEKARLPHDSLAPSAHGPLRSTSQIRSDLARRIFRGALGNPVHAKICQRSASLASEWTAKLGTGACAS